jgi:acyl carrier protein
MIPAGFVFLDGWPLTPHGKIDRKALQEFKPVQTPAPNDEPTTDTERIVAALWKEIFRVDSIGRHDHFFDRGGDSLRAMVVAARLHSILGVELDPSAFAAHPTLADLAAAVDELRRSGRKRETPPLVRVDRSVPLPLSFAQERTWRYSQTRESAAGYTVASSQRIRGPLDSAVLRDSIDAVVRRHEILRTTFAVVDGRPRQFIHPPASTALPLLDLTGASNPDESATRFFRSQARRPFDLGRLPLLRFHLVRLRPDEHWLLRVHHHLVSDQWSWKVFFEELSRLYETKLRGETASLPEPLQYGDYAVWQERALHPEGAAYRAEVAWWKHRFSTQPRPLNLPFRRRQPAPRANPADGVYRCGLDPRMTEKLDRLGREVGATAFVVRLAAFVAVLAAVGTPEVVLGAYVTNRNRVEVQTMFGFFANLATLCLRCGLDSTFRQWVAEVRTEIGEIQGRTEIPYEQLCEELRRQGVNPPEIRLIFGVTDRTATVRLGDAELSWLEARMETMPWGFTVSLDQSNEQEVCRVTFDARLYDPQGVQALVERFGLFLAAAVSHPDGKLSQLLADNYRFDAAQRRAVG